MAHPPGYIVTFGWPSETGHCHCIMWKHVDLRSHFIRAQVSEGIFDLQYCPTDENLADAFTKALPRPRLEKLRAALRVSTARGGVL
jgi:hypothetical protein